MKKIAYTIAGVMLAAGTAHAQPADEAAAAEHGAEHSAPSGADAAASPDPAAEAAAPADALGAEASTSAEVTEAEIDSFARATVKLHEIQGDASIAEDQKQSAMAAAVTEAGLDAAKYNEIGQAAQADADLRARVQTAMSRYATPGSDG